MADHTALNAVLDNTQVPHQPLVVIVDSAVFSGLPIFKESLRRALNRSVQVGESVTRHKEFTFRGGPVVLVTALHSVESLGGVGAQILPLGVLGVPGFDSPEDEGVEDKITSAYQSGSQVYIDAIDIVAEDYSPALALRIVRSLLRLIKTSKAPSRLTLLLPHTSSFLPSLFPPTLSPAITLLHTYNPAVLSHLSRSYLMPIEPSANFMVTLDRARDRQLPEKLAYGGLDGVECAGDWTATGGIVSILVRKATGGVKGISRSLASISGSNGMLSVGPVSDLLTVNPIDAPGFSDKVNDPKPATTHVDLNLPFNLSLTDEQKRRRGEVPLPYAHEGEGVGIEYGEEEDDEDED